MSQKSFEDRHKIFYVTYGQKLTILHPLEADPAENIHCHWCQNIIKM